MYSGQGLISCVFRSRADILAESMQKACWGGGGGGGGRR